MSSFKRKIQGAAVLALTALLASGCGSSPNSTSSLSGNYATGPGGTPIGPGGCVPLDQTIAFQGFNIVQDYAQIRGGQLPYGGSPAGQMQILGTGGYSPQPYSGFAGQSTYYGYSYFGTLNINMQYGTQGGMTGSYGAWMANAQGTVRVNSSILSVLYYDLQYLIGGGGGSGGSPYGYGYSGTGYPVPGYSGYPGYGGYGSSQYCVSQVALEIAYYGNYLYNGKVYLYINGTQHGVVLSF